MEFPQVPWSDFRRAMQWEQGEHVTMIAPTQQGKTTLARQLLPARRFVMVLATKRKDKALQEFADDGYRVMPAPQEWAEHVVIRPPFPRDPDKLFTAHRATFRRALTAAYQSGGWTVYADEIRYLTQRLKLAGELELLWLQGAGLGVTVVCATQRPRNIPLEAYDQATHLFLWRDSDRSNVERLAEIGGTVDRAAIMRRVPQLPRYQFVYVNTRTDTVIESKVEL